MCVQPAFIIGTNNEDGTPNFAPITWASATHEDGEGYLFVISMFGTKMTRGKDKKVIKKDGKETREESEIDFIIEQDGVYQMEAC